MLHNESNSRRKKCAMPNRKRRARRPSGIDERLDELAKQAARVRLDDEIRRLDEEIPISPVGSIAPPHRPPPRWAERSVAGAANAAAIAAAERAAAAEAELKQRKASAATAAVMVKAAEDAAAAALIEAHAAADAAAARRAAAELGERRRPARPVCADGGELLGTDALQRHVSANDWVGAARVAVAMAIQQSLEADHPSAPRLLSGDEQPHRAGADVAGSAKTVGTGSGSAWQHNAHHSAGADALVVRAHTRGSRKPGGKAPQPSEASRPARRADEAAQQTGPRRGVEELARIAEADVRRELAEERRGEAPMTHRRLRSRMLKPAPVDGAADANFVALVARAEADAAAEAAASEPATLAGPLSFVGATSAITRKAARHDRARAARRPASRRAPGASEGPPSARAVNMDALDAEEARAFALREAEHSRVHPTQEERILQLMGELEQEVVPRDFDREIEALLGRAELRAPLPSRGRAEEDADDAAGSECDEPNEPSRPHVLSTREATRLLVTANRQQDGLEDVPLSYFLDRLAG